MDNKRMTKIKEVNDKFFSGVIEERQESGKDINEVLNFQTMFNEYIQDNDPLAFILSELIDCTMQLRTLYEKQNDNANIMDMINETFQLNLNNNLSKYGNNHQKFVKANQEMIAEYTKTYNNIRNLNKKIDEYSTKRFSVLKKIKKSLPEMDDESLTTLQQVYFALSNESLYNKEILNDMLNDVRHKYNQDMQAYNKILESVRVSTMCEQSKN